MSTVVVGYDGSAAGERALVEAAHQASSRGLPLTVVHAIHQDVPRTPVPAFAGIGGPPRLAAEGLLADAADLARYRHPGIAVRTSAAGGPAPEVLARASREAELLVVGRRDLDPLEAMLSASVSERTVALADCPVLVVRDQDRVPRRQVLAAVSLDGSARPVLGFAFAEAARRRTPLRAVHVENGPWTYEPAAEVADLDAAAADRADLELRLQVLLRMGEAGHPGVEAYPVALRGGPPELLLADASQSADMLVLGARRHPGGLGGLGGLNIGPVVRMLLRTSACPVAVVPVD